MANGKLSLGSGVGGVVSGLVQGAALKQRFDQQREVLDLNKKHIDIQERLANIAAYRALQAPQRFASDPRLGIFDVSTGDVKTPAPKLDLRQMMLDLGYPLPGTAPGSMGAGFAAPALGPAPALEAGDVGGLPLPGGGGGPLEAGPQGGSTSAASATPAVVPSPVPAGGQFVGVPPSQQPPFKTQIHIDAQGRPSMSFLPLSPSDQFRDFRNNDGSIVRVYTSGPQSGTTLSIRGPDKNPQAYSPLYLSMISTKAVVDATGITPEQAEVSLKRYSEAIGETEAQRTKSRIEMQAQMKDLIATVSGAVAAAQTGGRLQERALNFGIAEVQKGQRIFDTSAGKDVTSYVGTGKTEFNPDTMVSIPQGKAADLQLALARRNSYVKLSNEIESEVGKADELFKRGQINAREYAKNTTGSSVLQAKIAALNDHALTSMRILTGGAPRSEQMLEVSQLAFGKISPGTAKEVVAQKRQNFLIQMDEQIKGLQYGLQAPTGTGGQGGPGLAGPSDPLGLRR